MRTSKQLLFMLSFLLSATFAFSQTIDWQVHQGQGAGIFTPGPDDPPIQEILNELTGGRQPIHGDPGGFQYAEIPPANDIGWEPAPIDEDGDLCWRLDRSRLDGFMTALDFTYFQTTVNVTNASEPFILRFFQVDDGARAYVFNSVTLQDPENAFIEGGDARLFAPIAETDISSLFVEGEENRIIIVQFDDSETANFLKVEVIGGEGIGEGDECDDDTEAPTIDLSNITLDTVSCVLPLDLTAPEIVVLDNCDESPTVDVQIEIIEVNDTTIIFSEEFGERPLITEIGTSVNYIYTATDASGNVSESAKVEAYFIVPDEEAPVVDCIENIELTPENNGAIAVDDIINLIPVIDNCTDESELVIDALYEDSNGGVVFIGRGDSVFLSGSSSTTFSISFEDAASNRSEGCFITITDSGTDPCANDTASPTIEGCPTDVVDVQLDQSVVICFVVFDEILLFGYFIIGLFYRKI
ncbi:MAG: hypothetical protein AAF599_11550, partial [Bacteroidota bacterium]